MGEFIAVYWKWIIVGLFVIFLIMLAYFKKVDDDRRRK